MLRLFTNHSIDGLWRCSHFVASCVTKRQIGGFLPVSSAGLHRLHIPARRFSTGIPVPTDALQPKGDTSKEIQTLDLDKWKSIMRSKVAPEEKQEVIDEEEGSDGEGEGEDLKDSSSPEAIRELVAMWRLAGKRVPQVISDEELQILAERPTKSARKKYLKHLAIKEGLKLHRKEKKQQKKAERQERRAQCGDDEREPMNTMQMQFWSRSLDKHLAWRSAQAMVFGQPLVFDMSYEAFMSLRDMENAVTQLLMVDGVNRRAKDPFHLHYCNLQETGAYQKVLLKRYGEEALKHLLITMTDQHYVDVFPREKLVYLSADSPNVLRKFDHSKVYIVGALVDRSIQPGLSLANAKRLNLATARLPLDEYLQWEIGGKNLSLDQMIQILNSIKDTGKWEEALKFVPARKFDGFHQGQSRKNTSIGRAIYRGPRQGGDRLLRPGDRNVETEGFYRESGFSGRDRIAANKHARRKGGKSWWDKE